MADHDELVLGVRPEDVELVGEVATDRDFPATVDVVEPMGDENQVHLRFDAGGEADGGTAGSAATAGGEATVEGAASADGGTLVATISGMRRVEDGERVAVRIPEDAVHLFDRDTGEALHNRELETAETAPTNA